MWQPIETAPNEELVYVFGKHDCGTPWWNVGTRWGDEWDGPWHPATEPTHWARLVGPQGET